jgi:hypothetical protein
MPQGASTVCIGMKRIECGKYFHGGDHCITSNVSPIERPLLPGSE